MKFAKLAVAAAILSASPIAANAAELAAGAKVTGPEGNAVGTVVSVENGIAVVDTGKHKAPLPANVFGETPDGFTISVTKAQIDSMIEQQMAEAAAKRDAALMVGANVVTSDSQPLGTVNEIDGDNVVIAVGGDEATKVTLLREYFVANDTSLMARLTKAQIDEAMSGGAAAETEAAM